MGINALLLEIKSRLESEVPDWPVGLGEVTDGDTHTPGERDHYFIVHYLGYGGVRESTMSKDQAIKTETVQVTVTAATLEQCSWGVDKVEDSLLNHDFTNSLWQQLEETTDIVVEESGLWTGHLTLEFHREGVA